MKRIIFSIGLGAFLKLMLPALSLAQLATNGATNATQVQALVQTLKNNRGGVAVSNVSWRGYGNGTGESGSALGSFSLGSLPMDGMTSGVVLSTGKIADMAGPNYLSSAGSHLLRSGDADLSMWVNGTTSDATVLEFDVVASGSLLSLQYMFASEEYPEKVCLPGADAFAIFISGPGISGRINIAEVPGYPGVPVGINSVNNGAGNAPGVSPAHCQLSYAAGYVDNPPAQTSQSVLQYDGYTRLFTASAAVQPCQTYRIKIVIADGEDGLYDSGLLLAAGSLTSETLTIQADRNTPLCQGDTIRMAVQDGYHSYQWYKDGTAIAGANQFSYETGTAGIYTVEVKKQACSPVLKSGDREVEVKTAPQQGLAYGSRNLCAFPLGVTLRALHPDGQYRWLPGEETTRSIKVTTPGTYSVEVIDQGCTTVSEVEVRGNTMQLEVDSVKHVSCYGYKDGAIAFGVTGKNTTFSYQWTKEDDLFTSALQSLCCLTAGWYTATVTDADGCIKDTLIEVRQPDELVATATQIEGTGGSGEASVTGGTPPYLYTWMNAQHQVLGTDATIDNLPAGVYTLAVRDSNNCTTTTLLTITGGCSPVAFPSATRASCVSASDGMAGVSVTGLTGMLFYEWTGPDNFVDTTSSLTGLKPGTYQYTVRDTLECRASGSIVVGAPDFVATVSVANTSCYGTNDGSASVTIQGGIAPLTYRWLDSLSQLLSEEVYTGSILGAGQYQLEITDASACVLIRSFTIQSPDSLHAVFAKTDPVCPGSVDGTITTTVGGGTAPYTYQWMGAFGAASMASLQGLDAGSYTLALQDSKGCAASLYQVVLGAPDTLSLTVVPGATGKALAVVSGSTSPYTYAWSHGATTDSVSGLKDGIAYTVVVTDSKGCQVSTVYTPEAACSLSVSIASYKSMDCYDKANGYVHTQTSGGRAPYTYLWSGPDAYTATTAHIDSLANGTYILTVTDSNACTATLSADIQRPMPFSGTLSKTPISCHGKEDGKLIPSLSGGTPGAAPAPLHYEYVWKKDSVLYSTEAVLDSLSAGIYTLAVTDAAGCTLRFSDTLVEPALLIVQATPSAITCYDTTDGKIVTQVQGGTAPYEYRWSKTGNSFAAAVPSIEQLAAGEYHLTVTDARGCQAFANGLIIVRPAFPLVLTLDSIGAPSCANTADGIARVTATGGYGSIAYTWKRFDNLLEGTAYDEDQYALAAGTYRVYATDSGGCVQEREVLIVAPAAPVVLLDSAANVCEGQSVRLRSSQQHTLYTYAWYFNNEATAVSTDSVYLVQTPGQSGFYRLVIGKPGGCLDTSIAVQITVNPLPLATISTAEEHFCEGTQAVLKAAPYPGGVYTWKHNGNPVATPEPPHILTTTLAGVYTLDLSTPLCAAAQAQQTLVKHAPFGVLAVVTDAVCSPIQTGAVVLDDSAAYGTVRYDWAHIPGHDNPASLTGLAEGFYSVTATDEAGCVVSKQIEVGDEKLHVQNTLTHVSCQGATTGAIELSVSYQNQSGGGGGNCYAGTPGTLPGCSSGCISISGSGHANVGTGDTYCVGTGNTYTGGLSMSGGTLLVCGTIDVRSSFSYLSFNSGRVVVLPGGKILTNQYLSFDSGIEVENYGEIVGGSGGIQALKFENYGSVNIGGNVHFNNGGKLYNYASLIIGGSFENNAGAAGVFENYGSVEIAGSLISNTNSTLVNYCTLHCFALAYNTGSMHNYKTIKVSSYAQLYTGILLKQGPGALFETDSLLLSGGVIEGEGASCSAVKVNSSRPGSMQVIGTPAKVLGKTDLCTGSAIVYSGTDALSVLGAEVTTNCSCSTGGGSGGGPGAACTIEWTGAGVEEETGSSLSGLAAGVYTATVTCGECTKVYSYTIEEPPLLRAKAVQLYTPSCYGASDGGIRIKAFGGTPATGVAPYTYQWTGTGGFSSVAKDLNNLPAGSYELEVKDKNNCTYVLGPIELKQPALLRAAVECSGGPSCSGASNGSAYANIAGGTAPYTYIWRADGDSARLTQSAGPSIGGLPAGTYTLEVKDANLCTTTASVVVPEATNDCISNCTLGLSLSAQDASCSNLSDGVLVAVVSGGAGALTYDWSHLPGTQDPEDPGLVGVGSYTVRVKDSRGCSRSASATVGALSGACTVELPCILRAVTEHTAPPCPDGANGTIRVTSTGAQGATTMDWLHLPGEDDPAELSGLVPGLYTGMLRDAQGCVAPVQVVIEAKEFPQLYYSALEVCMQTPVTLVSSYMEGNLWSTGATTREIVVTAPGTYILSVSIPGCGAVQRDTIELVSGQCHDRSPICDPPVVVETELEDRCEDDEISLAFSNAQARYLNYLDDLKADFRRRYTDSCMQVQETFVAQYDEQEHHYTLYYYDQAGNLVRTVPPEGVRKLSDMEAVQARDDSRKNTRTVYTDHTLTSTYTYNSLNQLIAQHIPDHDPMDLTRTSAGATGIDEAYTVSDAHFSGDGQNGYVLAYDEHSDGRIYFTRDGGQSWSELSSIGTEDLYDIEIITNEVMYAVGSNGSCLVSTDGGKRWLLKETGIGADLIKIHFFSAALPLTDGILFDRQGRAYQTTDGGGQWTLAANTGNLYALLAGAELTDLEYRSNTEVWATARQGQTGMLCRSTDGGYTWTKINAVWSALPVVATSLPAAHIAVAAYGKDYLFVSADNGLQWKAVPTAFEAPPLQVRFRSATQGMVLVNDVLYTTIDGGATWQLPYTQITHLYMEPLPSQNGYLQLQNGDCYHTANGGMAWSKLNGFVLPAQTTSIGVTRDGSSLLAGSQTGAVAAYPLSGRQPVPGESWTVLATTPLNTAVGAMAFESVSAGTLLSAGQVYHLTIPIGNMPVWTPAPGGSGYTELCATADGRVAALQPEGALLYSSDGGSQWTAAANLQLPSGSTTYRGLSLFWDGTALVATVGDGEGHLYRHDDLQGTSGWLPSGGTVAVPALQAVSIGSSGQGVAGGAGGMLLHTDDGGIHWQLRGKTLEGTVTDLAQQGVYVLAGTASGHLYRSDDEGSTFAEVPGSTTQPIQKVAFAANGRGYALDRAGTMHYLNSGQPTWTPLSKVVQDPLYDLAFAPDGAGVVAAGGGKVLHSANVLASFPLFVNVTNSDAPILYDADMPDATNGYAVGKNGVAIKTTNGGTQWQALNSGTQKTLYAVDFLDAQHGVIGGDGVLRLTAQGGADNFGAVAVTTNPGLNGYQVRQVRYLDQQHLIAAGKQGSNGFVYTSSDGGQHWEKETYAFAEPLYALHFANSTHGLAAGRGSNVYKVVRDGSTYTWTEIPILPSSLLDGRKILNIHMLDADVWYVAGENGLLLRTDNGGDNWHNLNNEALEADLSFITPKPDGTMAIGGNAGYLTYLHDERSRYTDKYWYDELGRLVASQNSRQNNTLPKTYSYTLYDYLGRISEVGELQTSEELLQYTHPSLRSQVNYAAFRQHFVGAAGNVRRQITRTYYDASAFELPNFAQQALRNRVASITYTEQEGGGYDYATHYSYDVHGNVQQLLQDNALLTKRAPSLSAHRYKRVHYDYDLISGNVHQVHYQPGYDDQYYHRYDYDADNRITHVYTSRDGQHWERDAKYFYYRHGPLARTELGHDKIQATDYAYTLQGWIKGVNATLLTSDNDPGQDGKNGTAHRYIGTDAAGYQLHYYSGDYKSIGTIGQIGHFVASLQGAGQLATDRVGANLYNGNIAAMATSIHDATGQKTPQLTAYRYDQLNRIRTLRAYRDVNLASTNTWANAASHEAYRETFAYDANGNITRLTRKDHQGDAMDSLVYHYETTANGYKRNTNRLRAVEDHVSGNAGLGLGDLQPGQTHDPVDPSLSNYHYDELGNLVKDASEEIEHIEWNVYGKITKVTRTALSSKPDLEFTYDPSGQRISKTIKPAPDKHDPSTWTTTWYSRDAQGNILATYRQQEYEDTLRFVTDEYTLYGSARLGTREGTKTLLATEILESGGPTLEPPVYEPHPCDYYLTDNHGVYQLQSGQRAVIDEHVNFSGTLIQSGGTLLVKGTFHADQYYYHGGDITVTGKLYGTNWSSAPALFYIHCDYNLHVLTLSEGQYDMNEMIALGLGDNELSSVRVGKGYKITLYEHPGFTGRTLVLTADTPCFGDFDNLTSSIRVERLEGQSTACSPGVGSTSAVATITNYGTFQMQHPVFATGTKLYNYGSLQIGNFTLPSNSELHNFNSVNSTFFEVPTSALVYSKAASRIDADNVELRGSIEGDAFNYSSLTTTNTTVHTSGSIEGLLKLCTRQNLHEYGSVDSRVVKDCSFSIPVLQQRTASLYRSEQGRKVYELSNHLGNVLTTISDRRIGVAGSNPAMIDHYTAVILSSQDYYAFGWNMPGRKFNASSYRYGFNGKEDDVETGWQDYGMRLYNPQLVRFFTVDPITKEYPELTSYQFSSNTPIWAIDLDGLEGYPTSASDGYLNLWKAFDAWCDQPAGNNSWSVGAAAGGMTTETNGQVLWASLSMGMRNMSSGGGYKGIGASANRYRSPVTNKRSVIINPKASTVKINSAASTTQVHDNTTPTVRTSTSEALPVAKPNSVHTPTQEVNNSQGVTTNQTVKIPNANNSSSNSPPKVQNFASQHWFTDQGENGGYYGQHKLTNGETVVTSAIIQTQGDVMHFTEVAQINPARSISDHSNVGSLGVAGQIEILNSFNEIAKKAGAKQFTVTGTRVPESSSANKGTKTATYNVR